MINLFFYLCVRLASPLPPIRSDAFFSDCKYIALF